MALRGRGGNPPPHCGIISHHWMENFAGGIFLLETLKPGEEEIETIEQSMQVNMSFESDSDFVNQFFQLLDSSPLKLIELSNWVILPNLPWLV